MNPELGTDQFRPYQGLYTPLTYTLYALVAWAPALITANAAAGITPNPQLFHGLNLLLHLLGVLSVWRILRLLLNRTRQPETETPGRVDAWPLEWAACGGALLFAIHPIQVEPVAWVAGMKDLLFGLLSLVAVWYYLLYVDAKTEPGRPSRPALHYGLATGAFVLALLAKPTAVVVPVIVWLLAVWGWRRSWPKQISGLLVWFIIAVAWGMLTRWVQPASNLDFEPPLWTRPLVAGDALLFYLYKLVLPIRFGPDYGRSPEYVLAHGWLFFTGLVPFAVAVWIWLKRERLSWLATAAGVFVVVLLPVLGLIPFEFQRYSTVADRYVYLAMLGPALALAWGLTWPKKKIAAIGCAIVLGLFVLRSVWQIPYWHNTATFFKQALQVHSDSFIAHHNLGFALAEQGQDAEAVSHFTKALRLKPEFPKALIHFSEALRLQPTSAKAHVNLAGVLLQEGKVQEAELHYTEAIRLKPRYKNAHLRLSIVLASQGEFDRAKYHVSEVLRMDPDHKAARRILESIEYLARSSKTQ